jgi:hypothetical protein
VGRGPAAQGLVMWLMRLDHHVICFFLSPSIKFKSVGVGGRSSADPLDFRRVYFEIFLLGCLIPACFGTTSRELRNFKYFYSRKSVADAKLIGTQVACLYQCMFVSLVSKFVRTHR